MYSGYCWKGPTDPAHNSIIVYGKRNKSFRNVCMFCSVQCSCVAVILARHRFHYYPKHTWTFTELFWRVISSYLFQSNHKTKEWKLKSRLKCSQTWWIFFEKPLHFFNFVSLFLATLLNICFLKFGIHTRSSNFNQTFASIWIHT